MEFPYPNFTSNDIKADEPAPGSQQSQAPAVTGELAWLGASHFRRPGFVRVISTAVALMVFLGHLPYDCKIAGIFDAHGGDFTDSKQLRYL